MKKLIILAMILALMVMATSVLAVGRPWVYFDDNEDGLIPDYCDHPSPGEYDGY